MKKKNRFIIIFAIIVLFVCFLWMIFSNIHQKEDNIAMQNGVLDLRSYNFDSNSPVFLDEWEFFSNKLVSEQNISAYKRDANVLIPNVWSNYKVNTVAVSNYGTATYHLRIRVKDKNLPMAIRLNTISTAFRMYIEQDLVASAGSVSQSKTTYVPGYKPQTVIFHPESNEFDVYIQVSNYIYARGGIWYDVMFGSVKQIERYNNRLLFKDAFIIGTFVIMGLFFLCVYLFRPKLTSSLFVTFVSCFQIVRVSLNGSYLIFYLLPNISVYAFTLIDYLNLIWGVFFFNYLMLRFFSKVKYKKIVLSNIAMNVLFTIVILVSPLRFFTSCIYIFEAGMLLFMLISIYATFRQSIRGDFDAILVSASSAIVIASVVFDTLYQSNTLVSKIGEMNSLSFSFFTFVLSILIAKNLADALGKAEQLNVVLEEKLATEIAFLHAQIKPHFLFNTITAIISLSRTNVDKARSIMQDLSDYLRKSFDISYNDQFTTLAHEIELAKKYIAIQHARFENRFDVQFDVDEYLDRKIPLLIIQPLIENAILHGVLETEKYGIITVTAKRRLGKLRIQISDNGLGMTPEEIADVLQNHTAKKVGMRNIHDRLNRLYGEGLFIFRNTSGGLTVSIEIPDELE